MEHVSLILRRVLFRNPVIAASPLVNQFSPLAHAVDGPPVAPENPGVLFGGPVIPFRGRSHALLCTGVNSCVLNCIESDAIVQDLSDHELIEELLTRSRDLGLREVDASFPVSRDTLRRYRKGIRPRSLEGPTRRKIRQWLGTSEPAQSVDGYREGAMAVIKEIEALTGELRRRLTPPREGGALGMLEDDLPGLRSTRPRDRAGRSG